MIKEIGGLIMANLQDVSKQTGVSIAAISRILNQDPTFNVLESTREKVITAANELGYKRGSRQAKNAASTQVAQKELNIGIIQMYSDEHLLEDPYYSKIETYINRYKENHHFHTFRIQNNQDDTFSFDKERTIHGIFAIGIFNDNQIQNMKEISPNIVFIDSSPDDHLFFGVTPNFSSGVELALRHLISKGHTRIGFIGEEYTLGDRCNRILEPRRVYFESLMKPTNLFDETYVIESHNNSASGYEAMKSFLSQREDLPTALFLASDSCANGVMRALLEGGLRIPADISIITFNNTLLSQQAMIPLTSVAVQVEKMVIVAIKHMIDLLSGDATPVKTEISCNLIERESVSVNN